MIFGARQVEEALGCYLAHSQMTATGRIAKGTLLDPESIRQLKDSGISSVVVACLSADDVHENEAARQLANAFCGDNVSAARASTGRVNLHATQTGLCCFDRKAVIQANAVDEGITLACIRENQWVTEGTLLATIKIIPYAVPASKLSQAMECFAHTGLTVQAPTEHRVALIQTRLPSIKEAVLDKTRRITEQRLQQRNAQLISEVRCNHDEVELAQCLRRSTEQGVHWVLIAGASANSDRADVVPAAIEQAGGQIKRYGIPVDPGNLLLLADLDKTIIIGLPGCARSPKFNGFDQVLDRLACGQTISAQWLESLSVGGLLAEIPERPQPR